MRKNLYLIAEFSFLFILIPVLLLLFSDIIKGLIIPLLFLMAAILYFLLKRDKNFNPDVLKIKLKGRLKIKEIVIRFLILGGIISFFVYLFNPEIFLRLPRKDFFIWLIVLTLYTVLSVYPQELIYRVFFFHRYKGLFRHPLLRNFISAFCFGFAHIFFGNLMAPLMSFAGGLLFAYTYQKTNSISYSSLEHSLWGCLIFTIGLGFYFSSGTLMVLFD